MCVQPGEEFVSNAGVIPVAQTPPADRSMDAEFAGQLGPLDADLEHEDHVGQADPVVDACTPTPRTRWRLRDQRLDPFPQRIRDQSPFHMSAFLGRYISSHDHNKTRIQASYLVEEVY